MSCSQVFFRLPTTCCRPAGSPSFRMFRRAGIMAPRSPKRWRVSFPISNCASDSKSYSGPCGPQRRSLPISLSASMPTRASPHCLPRARTASSGSTEICDRPTSSAGPAPGLSSTASETATGLKRSSTRSPVKTACSGPGSPWRSDGTVRVGNWGGVGRRSFCQVQPFLAFLCRTARSCPVERLAPVELRGRGCLPPGGTGASIALAEVSRPFRALDPRPIMS